MWVADCETINEHIEELSQKILPVVGDRKLVLVFNKVDIISAERKAEKEKLLLDKIPERVFISAKYEQGTNQLEDLLVKTANIPEISEQDIIVTNVRHYEALQNALTAIKRVSEGLELKISGDFLSQDIRECLYYLGEITGQISTDEILGNIFSKFCIGK